MEAMRIGPLKLFSRTSSSRSFNLASWHSSHSLTWSWILSLSLDRIGRKENGWPRFGIHPFRTNDGLQVVLAVPFVCLQWHRQRPMWFKNMFGRQRDETEALKHENHRLLRKLTEAEHVVARKRDPSTGAHLH